jgi:glyoxylase-like metal-dependent hydrolase (beta-lactamase superfamily II)
MDGGHPLIEEYADLPGLRVLTAPNPGLFTLDGTRVHVLGLREVVIIDPGPDDPNHLDRLADLVSGAGSVRIALTHHHADHSAGVDGLLDRLGESATVDGGSESMRCDAGALIAVPTPGHSADHTVFHWPEADAVLVGDVILGSGDTTWLGEYRGCVRDYFDSLDTIERLGAARLLSAHGPRIDDPVAAIQRFRAHRLGRIDQVREALALHPAASAVDLTDRIYGALPSSLQSAAAKGVDAMMAFLEAG